MPPGMELKVRVDGRSYNEYSASNNVFSYLFANLQMGGFPTFGLSGIYETRLGFPSLVGEVNHRPNGMNTDKGKRPLNEIILTVFRPRKGC